jgi:uncharacterized lipoprotein YajG
MSRLIRHRRATLTAGAALALALALAGCGTPAVIKPVHNPLPGFKRDIQAAHSVVSQSERQASSDATSP